MLGSCLSLYAALLLAEVGSSCIEQPQVAPPPREPPSHLLGAFTLNHTVPLELYYVDDSNHGRGQLAVHVTPALAASLLAGTHYKYSQTDIEELIRQAELFISQALSIPTPPPPPHTLSHSTWSTQLSDIWLVHALHHHPVTGHAVVHTYIHTVH